MLLSRCRRSRCRQGCARPKWCPTPVPDSLVCVALCRRLRIVAPRTCGVSWYEECVVLSAVRFREFRCVMSRLRRNRASAQLRCLRRPPQHPSLALLRLLLQPHQPQAQGYQACRDASSRRSSALAMVQLSCCLYRVQDLERPVASSSGAMVPRTGEWVKAGVMVCQQLKPCHLPANCYVLSGLRLSGLCSGLVTARHRDDGRG
jgi:hypothetical protein